MTIKDFSELCNCSTQTLRYYDSIDLLKPVKVDRFTGYRYYDEEQALDFVKIKNLQEAGFSIEKIKKLLEASNEDIAEALAQKVAEEEEKLNKIKRIQRSYQKEFMDMQDTIKKIKEDILRSAEDYDPETSFGLTKEQYDSMIASACEYFDRMVKHGTKIVYSELGIQEDRIENPRESNNYQLVYEKHDFANVIDAIAGMPEIDGNYILHFETSRYYDNSAFSNVVLGYTLEKNKNNGKNLILGCNSWKSEDGRDHFWLLKYAGNFMDESKCG